VRNAVRYHELILSSDAGGYSLYHGNSEWTPALLRAPQRRTSSRAGRSSPTWTARRRLVALEREKGRLLTPRERSAASREWARSHASGSAAPRRV
jgi:hypothetical protein